MKCGKKDHRFYSLPRDLSILSQDAHECLRELVKAWKDENKHGQHSASVIVGV